MKVESRALCGTRRDLSRQRETIVTISTIWVVSSEKEQEKQLEAGAWMEKAPPMSYAYRALKCAK